VLQLRRGVPDHEGDTAPVDQVGTTRPLGTRPPGFPAKSRPRMRRPRRHIGAGISCRIKWRRCEQHPPHTTTERATTSRPGGDLLPNQVRAGGAGRRPRTGAT
jgi:hypothetical protein